MLLSPFQLTLMTVRHTFSHLSFKCDPNTKKDTIQILSQTCCSHVMEQLQIIILHKLYLHVIYIPPTDTHTHTCMHTHTHTHTHWWRGEVVFRSSICPQLHSLAPPKLVIGIQLSLQGVVCNSLPCAPSIYFFFYLNDL